MQTQLRDIEYFAAIAEHGQVQRAAEALGLSQPALSKSLRRLEQAMKAKLLRRTPKGVELTCVGSALLAQVRKLRMSVDDVTREIADLSEGRAGPLRIGTSPGFALYFTPTACVTLLKEAPRITLKITVAEHDAMLTAVGNGELDVVVTTMHALRQENLIEDHLYDQPFVVYASANHRLTKRKQVALGDLVQEWWALSLADGFAERQLSQVFAASGLPPPRISVETANVLTRCHLVAASELLGFNSRQIVRYAAAQNPIVELRVKDLSVTRRIGAFYRKDAYLSPAAKRFIEILKATAKEIAAEKS